MSVSPAEIGALIRRRRSVFPKFYLQDKPIDRQIIEQLLENAIWAPTHKRTEPWRFQVFHSPESIQQLGDYMSEFYRLNTPSEAFSEEKMIKSGENPRRAGAVIALVLHRELIESIPEFEEVAALAMAVQNMWLSCTALGLGCYWSTPRAALEAGTFLELAPNERCLGLFYLAWHEMPEVEGKRGPLADKVRWR
ncbi:MAG: nitroreductase [Saprospiraceae bacterium]|nr:nitroreductase [Saprospiraceae bacterium]